LYQVHCSRDRNQIKYSFGVPVIGSKWKSGGQERSRFREDGC
jgi:hypothetical protein